MFIKSLRLGVVILALVVLIGFSGISLVPKELRVPQNYKTIREAIVAAQPGDTILIAAGAYQENLFIDKSLTLRGEEQEKVIVVGGQGCQEGKEVIHIAARGVWIEGLTVTKCSIGIGVQGSAQLLHVAISGNTIGLKVWDSSWASLEDSLISDNTIGVEIWALAQATVANSFIFRSSVGIKVLRGASATIARSTIFNNNIGLEIWDAQRVVVKGAIIRGNQGDGIWVHGSTFPQVAIQNSTIALNGQNGIRLGASPYYPNSIRAEIYSNTLRDNQGCGIWVDEDPDIQVIGQNNRLARNGGGNLCPPTYPWPEKFTSEVQQSEVNEVEPV